MHSGEERYEVLPWPVPRQVIRIRSGPLGKFIKQCISQELARLRPNLVWSANCGEKRGGADTELQTYRGRGGAGQGGGIKVGITS